MNVFNKSSKLAVGFTLIRTLTNVKNLDKSKTYKSRGFTLIELLVVMVILGILAVVGISSFRTSLAKSRDAKRKSDLEQVQRALEMYYNDNGNYPSSSAGEIVIGVNTLSWVDNSEFSDSKGTIYIKELPEDPSGSPQYCYKPSASPVSYQLYATLENSQDPRCLDDNCQTERDCFGEKYNYGVSSSNTVP